MRYLTNVYLAPTYLMLFYLLNDILPIPRYPTFILCVTLNPC